MSTLLNQKAPEFALHNSEKQLVKLSEQNGKPVVLLFFPLAFTGTCTTELCSVRDNMATYNTLNAQVFGISVDSIFSLAKFKEEQKLNFPLLSDFNKEVSAAYNTLYADFVLGMKGVSKRSAFVIDAQGTVRYEEVLEDASKIPNFEAIEKALRNLN